MKSKPYTIVGTATSLTVALLLAAPLANATDDANNPLHPSYYMMRAKVPAAVESNTAASEPYVDTHSPLHPSHYAARGSDAPFVGTASGSTVPYVDDRNPLHPAHRFY